MKFKDFLEAEYWGSKAAGILVIAQDTKKLLLAMRSPYVNEPNTWGIIGGKIDNHDVDIQHEAKREFHEETGYLGPMRLIPSYIFKDGDFRYHNFIGLVPHEFQPKTNWETSYFKWVGFDELTELEPKHFGLSALLQHASNQIKQLVS